MTVTTHRLDTRTALRGRRLPALVPVALGAGALGLAALLTVGLDLGGPVMIAVLAVRLVAASLYVTARLVEGARGARNRLATTVIYGTFVLALLPLVSVAATVITKGAARLDANFFGTSMRNIGPLDATGGAYHAIVGTLEQVGIAVLITVPLGIATAIYVVEYGQGRRTRRLARAVQFFVDVMTGIPSIVAGLFILAFWVLIVSPVFNNGTPQYSGFAASLALSVLMLPTVVRSTEEMLRLVPGPLREGAYALGIPKWKTILKIVLPTAASGIVTGVMLAIARAAGETAPVLLVAGATDAINFNPFAGPQSSLSLFVFDQASQASRYAPERAWTAALTLVALVLTLTVAAKLLARRSKLTR